MPEGWSLPRPGCTPGCPQDGPQHPLCSGASQWGRVGTQGPVTYRDASGLREGGLRSVHSAPYDSEGSGPVTFTVQGVSHWHSGRSFRKAGTSEGSAVTANARGGQPTQRRVEEQPCPFGEGHLRPPAPSGRDAPHFPHKLLAQHLRASGVTSPELQGGRIRLQQGPRRASRCPEGTRECAQARKGHFSLRFRKQPLAPGRSPGPPHFCQPRFTCPVATSR